MKDLRRKHSKHLDKKLRFRIKIYKLRKTRKSLEEGKLIPLEFKNPNILGFMRKEEEEETFVLTNFSEEEQIVKLPKGNWKTILSTKMDIEKREEKDQVLLRPSEGIILCS